MKSSSQKRTPQQIPRRISFLKSQKSIQTKNPKRFDYSLDYKKLNLRRRPKLYRVGVGEQGVLLVEPYKSEILPFWKFKTPLDAKRSSRAILKLFREYRATHDFVGMDMSRKFLQMGYTRSRRYANHSSGRKNDHNDKLLAFKNDASKAESAEIFYRAWQRAEKDKVYARAKLEWKLKLG